MTSSRLADQVGRVVGGRYRLVAPVGAGASAEVYLADDVTLGRPVAVKMLLPGFAGDARFLERFAAEARLVASVSHPNIVVVHDSGVDSAPGGAGEVPYLVTEYLGGGSLRGMLAAGHRLTPSQALLVGLEAARGLAHAHGRGLVHRDLKPANLLFGDDARLRIADFGVAHALAESAATQHDGALVGTLRYLAPEQARGASVGPKADVYALAMCLIEAVTGSVPFASVDPVASLHARTAGDLEVPAELGPIRSALERAGRLDVDERLDAEGLAIALLAASELLPAPAPLPLVGARAEGAELVGPADDSTRMVPLPELPAETPDPTGPTDRPRRWRSRRFLTALVASVLVLGAVVAFLTLRAPMITVPAVVGTQLDDLEAIAADHDWELDVKRTRQDGTEPGEIVSTSPSPGERLAEGGTLVVVVSEGNELTDRPGELIGRPLEEVIELLEDAGLRYTVVEAYDEEIPAGSVLGTDGPVDARLPRGSEVPLVVSRGPEPRAVPAFEEGEKWEAVSARISELGLVPVKKEVFSDDVEAGVVISLDPDPGTEVSRDSEVEVTVSKGPDLVAVPDMRGMTLDEAERRLEQAGLKLGQDCCASRGRVVGSDPPAGTEVKRGTRVNLFLAR